MKIKKVCKCGRIFYDTENNKKCPTCVMKRTIKAGGIVTGALAVGIAVKNIVKK